MQQKARRIYQFIFGFIAIGLIALAVKAFYTGEFNLVLKGRFSSHYSKSNFHASSAYLLASFCVLIAIGVLIMLMTENPKKSNYVVLKRTQRFFMRIGVLGLLFSIIVSRL